MAPRACSPPLRQGLLYLYGPYRRGGRHTAPSNEAFDHDLRARNAEWGVRDVDDVVGEAATQQLAIAEIVEMPANNLSVVLRREKGSAGSAIRPVAIGVPGG